LNGWFLLVVAAIAMTVAAVAVQVDIVHPLVGKTLVVEHQPKADLRQRRE
jgi:hypothetical protein